MDQSRVNHSKGRSDLVMGLTLYGRTWQLKDPNSQGIGSAFWWAPGTMGCLHISRWKEFKRNNNAKMEHDMDTISKYSYFGSASLDWVRWFYINNVEDWVLLRLWGFVAISIGLLATIATGKSLDPVIILDNSFFFNLLLFMGILLELKKLLLLIK